MLSDTAENAQRQTALEILHRSPVDFSRRASYGNEQRTEHVLVQWSGGRSARLQQSRDDRISFALRDRFESTYPTCPVQLAALMTQHGEPEAVTVAWSYESDWEGEQPRRQTGRFRFTWREIAELLALPVAAQHL